MAIEVRIPTILRTPPGGNKTVEGSGDTLGALVDDLDSKHPGLKNRLVTESPSFTWVSRAPVKRTSSSLT